MLHARMAVIGGTGVGHRLAALGGRAIAVPTACGVLRGRWLELGGVPIVLLTRHGVGHKLPPHQVNYPAMANGLKALGVTTCFATAAVGSLRPDWPAGTLVAPSDFLDLTGRNLTLFDCQVVHTDFSAPLPGRSLILSAAANEAIPIEDGGVYVCANGPRYETPHEVATYAKLGDVVGMTASSEAILMREAGIDYGLLAVVTNLACGISDQPLSHQEVADEMERSGDKAVRILMGAVALV